METARTAPSSYPSLNSANRRRADRLDFDVLLCRTIGFLRYQNGAGVREVLDAVCDVNICACGIVGLVYAMLDSLNDDFTSVYANANSNLGIIQARDLVLEGQGRKACANRVIFMRARGTKQGHDPVALRFVNNSLITSYSLIHQIERWLQALHPELGIT